jgi:hypothetical protein
MAVTPSLLSVQAGVLVQRMIEGQTAQLWLISNQSNVQLLSFAGKPLFCSCCEDRLRSLSWVLCKPSNKPVQPPVSNRCGFTSADVTLEGCHSALRQ